MSATELPTDYQNFIAKSRYSRWLPEENRRETWDETVARYFDFLEEHLQEKYGLDFPDRKWIEPLVLNLEVMPSMRALMTAGEAAKRDNTCLYNCSFLPVNDIKSFDETMLILMQGCGVGFSVERQFIQQLPEIPEKLFESDEVIRVKDSKEGWAKAFRKLLSLLYAGEIPSWDTSQVRGKGSILKTFGGRASGPEPLEDLFKFTVETFKAARGRKLNSLECHDMMCKIGEIVVSGGVRRSAMISLSNLSDERMRNAKSGEWWKYSPHRALANNSWTSTERPEVGVFMKEWLSLYESKSGERGIFNREGAQKQVERIGRDPNHEYGTNPCSEIILRPFQFCNLTEVVVRAEDDQKSLKKKAKAASILGTIQSTFTYFPYLRKRWRQNCEEERLLGVSLTGIMDNAFMSDLNDSELPEFLDGLRTHVREVNQNYADWIGIKHSAATTCVKPSGTVSQLVDSASGIHTRYSPYYVRTVRIANNDPIAHFLQDMGVPNEPCFMKPDTTLVFSFPIKSPDQARTRDDFSAIEQLELWKLYQDNYCDHKPSVTINVKEHEWPSVGAWIWENFDKVSGISFLPHSDHTYRQAPYQEVGQKEYEELLSNMPKDIDWSKLAKYEGQDNTASSQTMACSGDSCEIVDMDDEAA